MEEYIGFFGSIIGGIIGGLFTYLGVRMSINHDKEVRMNEYAQKSYENRPRLDIINVKSSNDYDVNAEIFDNSYFLNPKVLFNIPNISKKEDMIKKFDRSKLCYKEFEFKNIGINEIESINLMNNYPNDGTLMQLMFIDFVCPSLSNKVTISNEYVKNNETFKIRIYYEKGKIFKGILGPEFLFVMRDIYGNKWEQGFSASAESVLNSEWFMNN